MFLLLHRLLHVKGLAAYGLHFLITVTDICPPNTTKLSSVSGCQQVLSGIDVIRERRAWQRRGGVGWKGRLQAGLELSQYAVCTKCAQSSGARHQSRPSLSWWCVVIISALGGGEMIKNSASSTVSPGYARPCPKMKKGAEGGVGIRCKKKTKTTRIISICYMCKYICIYFLKVPKISSFMYWASSPTKYSWIKPYVSVLGVH